MIMKVYNTQAHFNAIQAHDLLQNIDIFRYRSSTVTFGRIRRRYDGVQWTSYLAAQTITSN